MNAVTSKQDYLYLRFDGPLAKDGRVSIGKAGKTMVAIDRWTKLYKKEYLNSKSDFVLRVGAIEKGSSEVQIFLEFLNQALNTPAGKLGAVGLFTQVPGVKDFLKAYGKTLGEQLALKKFAKGKPVQESDAFAKKGSVYVTVYNTDGESKEAEKKSTDFYRASSQSLNNVYSLEPGKEDKLRIGYHTDGKNTDTATITPQDKDSFVDDSDPDNLARRMAEPFEEKKAVEVKIIGQFVDFHGLAYRYKFSFQARREQEEYGKQKILCIVNENSVSEIIDLLKPENKKNICISGKATKDLEGKIDKIKIDWFNEDPDHNPDQIGLVE